jgi:hypothetical protein
MRFSVVAYMMMLDGCGFKSRMLDKFGLWNACGSCFCHHPITEPLFIVRWRPDCIVYVSVTVLDRVA